MNGKTIDWGAYDDADIARFITELYAEQEKRKEEKQAALREKIEQLLDEEGVDFHDIFGKVPKGKRRGKDKKRGQRAVQYRNPANPDETWTGVGRKPTWLVEALEGGRKLEDFAL